jgi:sporulation integral membrane protein YtvI
MPRPLLLIIYAACAVLAAIAVIKYILPLLLPFIIAVVFWLFMEPVIKGLLKLKLSRTMATLASMLLIFGGLGVVLVTVIVKLVSELIQLSVVLPLKTSEINIFVQALVAKVTDFYITLPPAVTSSLEQNINSITATLQGMAGKFANSLLSVISLVPGTLIILVVVFLSSFFIARDKQVIIDFIIHIIPAPWGEKIISAARDVAAAFLAYVRAQAILIFISTCLSVIGLYIIGADYALLMGITIGVFDLIPVLGPATIYLPWIVWSFATGATAFGVKLVVLYVVVSVARQILETKIVSGSLGLHPLATLISMYAGLRTMGLAGLVIGPILLIAIQSFYKAGILFPRAKEDLEN